MRSYAGAPAARDVGPARRSAWVIAAVLGVVCGSAIALADVNALILCVAALACVAILYDFRAGAVLLVLLAPLSASKHVPHAMFGVTGLNPFNLLLATTLGAYLLQARGRGLRELLPWPFVVACLVPMLVGAALGSRHVGEIPPFYRLMGMIEFDSVSGYLLEFLAKPLTLAAIGLLAGAAAARSAQPERLLLPALFSLWALCGMALLYIVQAGAGLKELANPEARQFLSGVGLHANELGRLYAFACALLLFTAAEARGTKLMFVLVGSLGLAALALMLTFSRGGLLAFLVSALLFMLWRRSVSVFLLALLGVGAAFLLPGVIYERIGTGFGEGANAISAGRVEGLWLPLLPGFFASPIYGSGLGSILWSGAMRTGDTSLVLGATTPHNAYLQALLDVGIAGLVLLCLFFAHVWVRFRAMARDASLNPLLRGYFDGAAAGLAGYLIAGVAGGSLTPAFDQCYLWIAIGMMYGLRERRT